MRRDKTRKTAAILLGVSTTAVGLLLSLSLGSRLAGWLLSTFQPDEPGKNVQGGELGIAYYLAFIGVAVAAGLIVTYVAWQTRPRSMWRNLILLGSFGLALVVAGANFTNNDRLLPYAVQAVINLVLVFLAGVIVLDLWQMRPQSNELKVLRFMGLALLGALMIALPTLFDLMWLLDRLRIKVHVDTSVLSAISSLLGVWVAFLDYRRKNRSSEDRAT